VRDWLCGAELSLLLVVGMNPLLDQIKRAKNNLVSVDTR